MAGLSYPSLSAGRIGAPDALAQRLPQAGDEVVKSPCFTGLGVLGQRLYHAALELVERLFLVGCIDIIPHHLEALLQQLRLFR